MMIEEYPALNSFVLIGPVLFVAKKQSQRYGHACLSHQYITLMTPKKKESQTDFYVLWTSCIVIEVRLNS